MGKIFEDTSSVSSSGLRENVRPIDQDRANSPKRLAKMLVPVVGALNGVADKLDSGGEIRGNDITRPSQVALDACEKVEKKAAAEKKAKAAAAKKEAREKAKARAKREASRAELENAIGAASYIDYTAFSRKGLIRQLSSDAGDGYPVQIATRAVDSLDINYNKQAVRAAKAYLDYTHFSRAGLVQQLESDAGDGYTHTQAEYGVRHAF